MRSPILAALLLSACSATVSTRPERCDYRLPTDIIPAACSDDRGGHFKSAAPIDEPESEPEQESGGIGEPVSEDGPQEPGTEPDRETDPGGWQDWRDRHGNNGHGNDEDGNDSSNPGNSNNGDGTDDDGAPGREPR